MFAMIYLDNSATTSYKPDCVKRAAVACMDFLSANAGRSGHKKSVSAAMLVYRTRRKTADFFKCDGDVAFTLNCTEALNLAILGSVREGGHAITTVREHNSVLRPLFELKRAGKIELSIAEPDNYGRIGIKQIAPLIRRNTYLAAVNHVSNVTGQTADIAEIGRGLKGSGIMLLVDGAQSAGYIPIDMAESNVSLLAVAPHKGLHALQGVGALCMAAGVKLKPIKYGGTGTQSLSLYQPADPPECYESGTLPLVAIAAMNRALDFTEKNFTTINEKIGCLTKMLQAGLKEADGIRMLSDENSRGIATFNLAGLSSDRVCDILDGSYGIAARGGLHCAPLIHKYSGTVESGAVRMSVGMDNTESDIAKTIAAVREIAAAAKTR